VGSRRNIFIKTSINNENNSLTKLGGTSSNGFIKTVASLESLKKEIVKMRSESPELEKKDEFASVSLWKVSAKANQEDFKEVFKSRTQHDTSEDLEQKLKDLIKSQKNKPASEPTKQVSPRTIKYLCNVIT
jgi:hypothetical protein